MSMRTPDISIVIPIFQEDSLNKTLQNLAYQTYMYRSEIILAEYNPKGSSYIRNILRGFKEYYEIPLRLIEVFHPGIAFARHEGIKYAHGEVICNFDADVRWNRRDALERMTDPIFRREAVMTNCDNLLDLNEIPPEHSEDHFVSYFRKTMSFNNWLQRVTPMTISDPGTCYRKDVYFEVGGYRQEGGETSRIAPHIIWRYPTGVKNIKGIAVFQSPRRALKGKELGAKLFDYSNAIRGKKVLDVGDGVKKKEKVLDVD